MKKVIVILLAILMLTIPVLAAGAEIRITLDKAEVTQGTATTVTLRVGTDAPITPVAISGEAYASDSRIKIVAINDGDKELVSNTKTGRFAWMSGRNRNAFSNWAEVVFSVPADLTAGTYTLGVRELYAADAECKELVTEADVSCVFSVKAHDTRRPAWTWWRWW